MPELQASFSRLLAPLVPDLFVQLVSRVGRVSKRVKFHPTLVSCSNISMLLGFEHVPQIV